MTDVRTVRQPAGWRDRGFAPVYAVVIAFLLAWAGVTVSAAASRPEWSTIRFVLDTGAPAGDLAGRRVEMYPVAGGPVVAGTVRGADLTIEAPERDYLLCVELGDQLGAVAKDAVHQGAATCWPQRPGRASVMITVHPLKARG